MDRRARGQVASGWTSFHRLRWIGVILPVAFILSLEASPARLRRGRWRRPRPHLALGGDQLRGVAVSPTSCSGRSIATQRQLDPPEPRAGGRQCGLDRRPGRAGLDVIIDAALESVIEFTGATEAVITVFPPDAGNRPRRRLREASRRHRTHRHTRGRLGCPTSSTSRCRPGPRSSAVSSFTCRGCRRTGPAGDGHPQQHRPPARAHPSRSASSWSTSSDASARGTASTAFSSAPTRSRCADILAALVRHARELIGGRCRRRCA